MKLFQQRRVLSGFPCICSALLFFTSCASLTPDRIATLVAIAAQAAQLGAQEWLAAHPEHRAAFQQVIDAINIELKAGNTTRAIAMLESLPVTSLSGKDGEIYWTGEPRSTNTEATVAGTLVVWDGYLGKPTRITGSAEGPVVNAVRTGLRRAVAPMPPALPVHTKRGVPVLGVVPESPTRELTDAELDAEFEAIKLKLKARGK